jgi:hypothetical protein
MDVFRRRDLNGIGRLFSRLVEISIGKDFSRRGDPYMADQRLAEPSAIGDLYRVLKYAIECARRGGTS